MASDMVVQLSRQDTGDDLSHLQLAGAAFIIMKYQAQNLRAYQVVGGIEMENRAQSDRGS